MANAILLEAALSFSGSACSRRRVVGLMVSTGRDVLLVAPHVATVPGLAIMLAVLAFNLVGDGLRDALDRGCAAPRKLHSPLTAQSQGRVAASVNARAPCAWLRVPRSIR